MSRHFYIRKDIKEKLGEVKAKLATLDVEKIAKELGLNPKSLSNAKQRTLKKITVIARSTPSTKTRVVKLLKELGEVVLENFHGHVAGIEYGAKGEKKHLIFEQSDFNYADLMKAFKKFDVKGAIVCESPNIETDTKILKDYYLGL